MIEPPSMMEFPARIPRIAFEVTDLPEPDSPTIASVSPLFKSKLMSRTACTFPAGVRNETTRLFTESFFSILNYSSVPLRDGLKASRSPFPNRLKEIISREI